MTTVDLKITDGKLVMLGIGIVEGGIAADDGKIVGIGKGANLPEADEEVDADGNLVMPGAIDPHEHMGIFYDLGEEAESETRSALAGGTTTVGCFVAGEQSYFDMMNDTIQTFEDNLLTDLFAHLVIGTEEQLEEIPDYVDEFGVPSFKFYMCGIPDLIPCQDEDFWLRGFKKVAEAGPEAYACVHAENSSIVYAARERVIDEKPDGDLADWAETHPDYAEELAINTAARLSNIAGNKLYMLHVSTKRGIEEARRVKEEYEDIFVETTSPYLTIDKYDEVGLLALMDPPVRSPEDIDGLWEHLENDTVDTIGTDDTSVTKEDKMVEEGIAGALPGYPVIETHLPAIVNEGYHKRNVPLTKIVEKTAAGPAKVHGIYPKKGTISVGSDADLVVLDLDKEIKVDPEELHSLSDFSLYQDKVLKGWPEKVIKDGKIAVEDGEVLTESGSGSFLRRS